MLLPVLLATALTLLIGLLLAFTVRLNAILPQNRPRVARRRAPSISSHARTLSDGMRRRRRLDRASRDLNDISDTDYPYQHIMIVLGSGGHTAEMLLMLRQVEMRRWKKRTWVTSSGDGFSAGLAVKFERDLGVDAKATWDSDIVELPRARNVHQSLYTTPISSLKCLWTALQVLRKQPPYIIITNGPGTGVILILASLILRFLAIGSSWKTRCIYVESLARCKTLSFSGRLLRPFVDRFLVQWQELGQNVKGAEFRGCFALDAAMTLGFEETGADADIDKALWITYQL